MHASSSRTRRKERNLRLFTLRRGDGVDANRIIFRAELRQGDSHSVEKHIQVLDEQLHTPWKGTRTQQRRKEWQGTTAVIAHRGGGDFEWRYMYLQGWMLRRYLKGG